MNGAIWYFAYGSNMDAEQMESRAGNWLSRVPGLLKGWRLEFNKVNACVIGAAYANIVPSPNSTVEGVLYVLTEKKVTGT
ncbi:MAG: gamma-glutamylcyclotransferase family protein [Desulfofundulus sp.]